jgi:hypothetical protein
MGHRSPEEKLIAPEPDSSSSEPDSSTHESGSVRFEHDPVRVFKSKSVQSDFWFQRVRPKTAMGEARIAHSLPPEQTYQRSVQPRRGSA